MSLSLHEKLKFIDSKVLFQKVLYDLQGLEIESTQQVHCLFHTDSNPSARIYIRGGEEPSSADGLFCWVCGNFSTSGLAIKSLGGIPQALEYFNDNYNIDFSEAKDSNTLNNKEISELIKKCKKHSQNNKWVAKDINRLSHYLKNYNDKFHKIRLQILETKLKNSI